MNQKSIWRCVNELDNTQVELSNAVCALLTIWEAMEHGAAGEKVYQDALYSVYGSISACSDGLRSQIAALLHEMEVRAG